MISNNKLKLWAHQQPWINSTYGVASLLKRSLFYRYPLSKNPKNNPFFIIGAARSGNTLLRAILAAHNSVAIPPESYALGNIARVWQRNNFLEWSELIRLVIGAFESHEEFYTWSIDLAPLYRKLDQIKEQDRSLAAVITEVFSAYSEIHAPGATLWGDKTPLNSEYLPWISATFPKAKYVHIIRDGRDAVASMMRANLQYGILDQCCLEWRVRVQNNLQLGKKLPSQQYLEIRYERLVSHPAEETERVCQFLNIKFSKAMLNTADNFHQMGDTVELDHHKNVENPINTESIGAWQRTLTEAQAAYVVNELGPLLETLGYR